MKGTIVKCLEEMVEQKYGCEKWKASLRKARMPESREFTILSEVDEDDFKVLLKSIALVLGISQAQLMDDFGEHWSDSYAPKVYAPYYGEAKNARELLLNLDHVHEVMTKSAKMGRPPRFRYEWKDDRHLIMHYQSHRGLIDLMPGLIRGVGKHFHESLKVHIVDSAVHVQFADPAHAEKT